MIGDIWTLKLKLGLQKALVVDVLAVDYALTVTHLKIQCPKLFGTPKMYQNGPLMPNYSAHWI